MKINELCQLAHETAKQKGWYDKERSPLEFHMLMVSEIAEATEEVRANRPPVYQICPVHKCLITPDNGDWSNIRKPDGELIELADLLIRLCDYAGYRGWDLEKAVEMKLDYNKKRSHRHGNKAY